MPELSLQIAGLLIPGAEVSIAANMSFIRITNPNGKEYINLETLDKETGDKRTSYKSFLTVSETADHLSFLIKSDVKYDDEFTRENLKLIEAGATYTFPIGSGEEFGLDEPNTELVCAFGVVLKRNPDSATMIGILHVNKEEFSENESVVAFMDLLGFAQMLADLDVDDIEGKYLKLIPAAMAMVGFTSAGAVIFNEEGGLELDSELDQIEYGIFSDTVVLYPRRCEKHSLRKLCESVAMVVDTSLMAGWLFRGGIEFGTLKVNEDYNLYLGTSIARAHAVEQNQEWMGCAIGPSVVDRYGDEVKELIKDGLLVEYGVPTKKKTKDAKPKAIALNWCYFNMGDHHDRAKLLKGLLKDAPVHARNKIENTIEFERKIRKRKLASIKHMSVIGIGDPGEP